MGRQAATSSVTLREIVVRIGLLVGGLAVALLVLELVLRAAGADAPAELGETFDRPLTQYRPQGGRINPWSAGHPDPLRVAVIGDSFTYGSANHGYDAYPARLEGLLNLNDGQRPAAVRSYAEPGSPTQGQLKLLSRALEWGPDVLILGIFLNDTEIIGGNVLHEMRKTLRPRIPQGRLAWVLHRSSALAWTYQRLENVRSSRAILAYFRYIYDPEYEGLERFARSIRRFRIKTEATNVRFLPVIFPGMAARGSRYRLYFAHERIHDVLESEGLEYLDLLEVFSDTMPVRMSAFPKVDPHPSEIAHRIAADAIFHRLLKDGTIDAGYRPKRTQRKGRRAWRRDLQRIESVVHLAPDD